MAAAIRATYAEAEVGMIPSGGGRFEVSLNGVAIFEKSKTGRHAKPGEILELLARGRTA